MDKLFSTHVLPCAGAARGVTGADLGIVYEVVAGSSRRSDLPLNIDLEDKVEAAP